jgi:hypothetical protein
MATATDIATAATALSADTTTAISASAATVGFVSPLLAWCRCSTTPAATATDIATAATATAITADTTTDIAAIAATATVQLCCCFCAPLSALASSLQFWLGVAALLLLLLRLLILLLLLLRLLLILLLILLLLLLLLRYSFAAAFVLRFQRWLRLIARSLLAPRLCSNVTQLRWTCSATLLN